MHSPLASASTSAFLLRSMDLESDYVPRHPGAYLRISEDPLGLERGVDRQAEDALLLQERLGWGPISKVYRENDTSAFLKKTVRLFDGTSVRRVIRPEFRAMLEDLRTGVIDGVIVYDLDRLARQPRDLEDLIDVVEVVRRPVQSATSTMDLLTKNGRMMARFQVTMALGSSEDTSRRVARAALADAKAGSLVRGGPRRFGWSTDGITLIPEEAATIRRMVDQTMAGETASSLALSLRDCGASTVTGKAWVSPTVTSILRSPRLAGIRGYQGRAHETKPKISEWAKRVVEIKGRYVMGPWQPILTVEEWLALQTCLDRRLAGREKSGNAYGRGHPKHLLSGIARCGLCGCPMVGRTAHGFISYGCRPKDLGGCNKVSRSILKVDALIVGLCIAKLTAEQGHLREVTAEVSTVDFDTVVDEVESRKRLLRQAWVDAKLTDEDFYAALDLCNERLREAADRRAQGALQARMPGRAEQLDRLADPGSSVTIRRAIISQLIVAVKIMPSSRGPHFCPDDIVAVWR